MKAITVRQPWAWAISSGAKTVENRTRGTSYRGPLAIHAGKGWSERGAFDERVINAYKARGWLFVGDECDPAECTFGAILGVAQLVDSHPDTGCCRPWGESSYEEAGGRTRTVIHHLVLEGIRTLGTPLPARGALGLWTPDTDLLEALGAALNVSELLGEGCFGIARPEVQTSPPVGLPIHA